jgi:hypothetical protein
VADAAPGVDLAGRCRFRETELNLSSFSLTPGRLSFHCGFARGGRPISAELVLTDPKSAFGTLHERWGRRGILLFEEQEIEVSSIHRDQGGGRPVHDALGYAFELDSRQIGAVNLNGAETIYAPRDLLHREAVIAAGLALSIF